jgi:hypothetical protein
LAGSPTSHVMARVSFKLKIANEHGKHFRHAFSHLVWSGVAVST